VGALDLAFELVGTATGLEVVRRLSADPIVRVQCFVAALVLLRA
jgi:hypothetical protein